MSARENGVAVVTGGTRGIGAAVVERLTADGWNVTGLGSKDCDVRDTAAVDAAFTRIEEEHGPILVLVNNAGVTRDNLLFKMSESDWDTVMGVHLKGAFLMSRACQKYMVDAKWGRIINLSSLSAVGNRGQVNYSTAKAGLQGLTKTLALELGKFGITANAVAPGFVVTDMTAATAARLGVSFEDFQAGAAKQIPVQRVGQVEDIAHAISFFASEGAGYVSGQILYLSGGPVS